MSNLEEEVLFDENGDLRINFSKMDPELAETLRVLNDSAPWRAYRQVLLNAKNHFFQSTLAIDETNKLLKHIGIVAGINFAINQLPILVSQHKLALEKELRKAEEKPVFKRG